MKNMANTRAVEWRKNFERKHTETLLAMQMPPAEILEMAFYAGYVRAEKDIKARSRPPKESTEPTH